MARVCLGNIMGPPGPAGSAGVPGPQGDPGYTPVKGVDYFTEEDINALNGQTFESTDHPGCYYRMVNEEVEWINPPLVVGVEYRTADRFMGRVVYKQAVDFGAMPNGDEKIVNYSTPSGTVAMAIKCWGYSSTGITLPYVYISNGVLRGITVYASETGVGVSGVGDSSASTAVLVVEYIKK